MHPAVAQQCVQAKASVREVEGPEFIEPGSAQSRIDGRNRQDRAHARGGDAGGSDQLLPGRNGGRARDCTNGRWMISHARGSADACRFTQTTTGRANSCDDARANRIPKPREPTWPASRRGDSRLSPRSDACLVGTARHSGRQWALREVVPVV